LFFMPAVVPVTFTLNVHEPLAAIVAPVKLMLPEAAVAVIVPPPQLPVSPFGVETTTPAGNVSVKPTPVSAIDALGLLMVKLSAIDPLRGTLGAANDLAMAGGATTVILAAADPPEPPSTEVTAPLVLFLMPAVVPVTFTLNVHEPLAAIVAPVRLMLPEPAVAVMVPPPQLPLSPFGVETTSPAGNVSVKPTPVSAVDALGLLMVKLSEVDPFSGTLGAPKDFAIDGGAGVATETLAEAVLPVPPSTEVTAPLVLFFVPAVVPVTFTLNVHEPLAAIVPPVRLMLPDPATAEIVPLPQLPVSPFGVETTRPAGNESVNPTPVSAIDALGLLIVKLSEVDPLSGMLAAPKDLAIVGGTAASTVTVAEAVPPGPLSTEVTAPLVLFLMPAVVPVTFTLKVHEPLAAIVAPVRLTVPDPAVAVIAPPPQLPVSPFGVETTRPAGNESVTLTPVSAMNALGLLMVKLSEVDPFCGMFVAPKDLAIVGTATTETVAEPVLPVPPSTEVTALVVLLFTPAVVPVTFTLKVHEPLAAIVAPVRLMLPDPAVAMIVPPPQLPVSPLGVETTSPAGKASVKPTPVSAVDAFELLTVKLSEVDPLTGMVAAPNDFAMAGGPTTVTLAAAALPVPP